MKNVTITGWGRCIPQPVVTNDDLATVIDTSDEWITSRSGIKERHISHVSNSEMAALAGRRAVAAAGLQATDIDYIIVATCTPDRPIPATAAYVQAKIGAVRAAVADINAGCTGFLYGLSMAHGLIATSMANRVLLIGSEQISSYLNLEERSTAVLFGDGAGAAIVEASNDESGIKSMALGADGSGAQYLTTSGLGTEQIGTGAPRAIIMDGAEIFKGAVVRMGDGIVAAAKDAGWELDEIDLVIPHQANIRIIDAVRRRIKVDESKMFINIHKYGNTSAATIPIALAEAVDEGRVAPGSRLIFTAFGAGVTWGAVAFQWGDRTEPISTTDDELPEPTRTGLEILLARQEALNR
ncbi:MAG: beta-ketoacyl-ACP synthase III [Actinomycetota bacterium]|nr:beta-ketoacyl-ACP synthase III [Actinomycetota bacterium]